MNSVGSPHPDRWIRVLPEGLFVEAGGFYVDPARPVHRAVISHGHADHARPNHSHVLATPETLAIMRQRYGDAAGGTLQPLAYGEAIRIGDVTVRLEPAGHVLGSAQIVLEHAGSRVVVSGDYKRSPDPTCTPFMPVPCDVFVTEATFGLPVFRHAPVATELAKLTRSLALFPERAHVVGVYALGKCQRLIALLRQAGYDRPIFLHGALSGLCDVYQKHGVALGPLLPATVEGHGAGSGKDGRDRFRGEIVLAPPSAIADRWSRRLPDPIVAAASGWMRVRQRARQRGVELPMVISDHADWDDLITTIEEVDAPEVWVTHGREEALIHQVSKLGRRARALALLGREDEDADEAPKGRASESRAG